MSDEVEVEYKSKMEAKLERMTENLEDSQMELEIQRKLMENNRKYIAVLIAEEQLKAQEE